VHWKNGWVSICAKTQGICRPDIEGTDAIFIQVTLTGVIDSTRTVEPTLPPRVLPEVPDSHVGRGTGTGSRAWFPYRPGE
jgi:hypothetical protein